MANHKNGNNEDKSLEQWLWDAACSIRGTLLTAGLTANYKGHIIRARGDKGCPIPSQAG